MLTLTRINYRFIIYIILLRKHSLMHLLVLTYYIRLFSILDYAFAFFRRTINYHNNHLIGFEECSERSVFANK